MRPILLTLVLAAAVFAGESRTIELRDGTAHFEWINASSFRMVRSWHPNKAPKSQAALVLESDRLKVEIDTSTAALSVKTTAGKVLTEIGGPVRAPGKIVIESKRAEGEQVYGNTGASANSPFIFTSNGYGASVGKALKYLVDVQQDRIRFTTQGSDNIELFFFYGPNPKEIFEQRKLAIPVPEELPVRVVDLERLGCDAVQAINNESLAASFYEVNAGPKWEMFLGAYMREIHDRGLPIFRPLFLQFPKDPNAARQPGVTMFGDEILLAPKCASPITLPQGLWTNLKTDMEHKGRTQVELTDEVTLFARNGTIVPIQTADRLELHYYPKLAAEFFLYEAGIGDYSQAHASEALDIWRVQIESKVARRYEWVIHHLHDKPLRIPVDAKPDSDNINTFEVEPRH